MKIDKYDKQIIKILQSRARINNITLASEIGLSTSATLRRVQALENSEIILGYEARINGKLVNSNLKAIIKIRLDAQDRKKLEDFEIAVAAISQVIACYLVSGNYDYLLILAVKDIEHYDYMHKNYVSTLPHVSSMQSDFSIREIVNQPTPINL